MKKYNTFIIVEKFHINQNTEMYFVELSEDDFKKAEHCNGFFKNGGDADLAEKHLRWLINFLKTQKPLDNQNQKEVFTFSGEIHILHIGTFPNFDLD